MQIILLKPHTHAGSVHPVDAELDLDAITAQWLIAQGVARAIDATESTQPNTSNGEAVLTSVHIMAAQPSSFWSHVAELPHLRMTRNDNIDDGQIITLGAERWFIAPVYRKNTTSRNASPYNQANHSGTVAMAVRYDGP